MWKNKGGIGISTQMYQDYYESAILPQNESYYSLIYWHSGQDLIHYIFYTLAGLYVCVCMCCGRFSGAEARTRREGLLKIVRTL